MAYNVLQIPRQPKNLTSLLNSSAMPVEVNAARAPMETSLSSWQTSLRIFLRNIPLRSSDRRCIWTGTEPDVRLTIV